MHILFSSLYSRRSFRFVLNFFEFSIDSFHPRYYFELFCISSEADLKTGVDNRKGRFPDLFDRFYDKRSAEMEKKPIFPKLSHSDSEEKHLRIFWCREYDNCLSSAAMKNSLLDCSQCPGKDTRPYFEPEAALSPCESNIPPAGEKEPDEGIDEDEANETENFLS